MKQPGVLAMLLFGESLMPAISILLGVYAYSLGPASLVAAVLATRPLFVFIASTLLSPYALAVPGRDADPSRIVGKSRVHSHDCRRRGHAQRRLMPESGTHGYPDRRYVYDALKAAEKQRIRRK